MSCLLRLQWICLVAAAVFVMTGCQDKAPPEVSAKQPDDPSQPGVVQLAPDSPKLQQLKIEPVVVREAPLEVVVAPGKLQANPNRVSRILLPVPGKIVDVKVRLGDPVHQGDPLLDVDSPDAEQAQSEYLQAKAAATRTKASLVKAQADLDRIKDLYDNNAVARKELLNAQNGLTEAQSAVEQSDAATEQAKRRLEILGLNPGDFRQYVTVRSPIDGKILEINVTAGEYRNDTTASLMTVADLSTVWVASDVPESDVRFIKIGEAVDITLTSYPDEVFRARVARTADTIDPQTRTLRVWAELANPSGKFRPEMFGEIRHIESTRPAPVVPKGAVLRGDVGNTVFVETRPGEFKETPVKLGPAVGDDIVVLDGLKAGERIVTDGAMLLRGM